MRKAEATAGRVAKKGPAKNAVADVIEAMASHRPYRPALGIDKALDEISKNKGRIYDADVVDACLELFTEKGYKFKE